MNSPGIRPDRTADYIIIGSGSAGAVVANRLTEDPNVRVLLLEAGGADSQFFYRLALGFHSWRYPETGWGYWSEPEPYLDGRRLLLPRGKVLGGSSTVNGMLYSRGHPGDYDLWRQMGCEGWSFADVLPYFRRAETNWRGETPFHGGDGPLQVNRIDTRHLLAQPVLDAARNLGWPITDDHHGEIHEGFGGGDTTTDARGRRSSTARAYLHPIRRRPNLTIVTGAFVTRILLNGNRATGVAWRENGQDKWASAAQEVVLSGGVYNSPQLLMLSGIGPADHLRGLGIPVRHDLPGVGGNISEHACWWAEYATRQPVSLLNKLRADRLALSVAQWMLFGTGVLAHQSNSCHAEIRSLPHLDQPDIQAYFNPVRADAQPWFPGIRPVQEHRVSAVVCLLPPESRGHLRLASDDPFAKPRIQLNLMESRKDVDALIRSVKLIRELYETAPLSDLVSREISPGAGVDSDADIEAFLRRTLATSHHAVGSCTMGHGPLAVVDPQLRVHGMEGLRVIDASVMPTVPGGNTNAPSIMIGEKGADLLRGRRLPSAEVKIKAVSRTLPN